MGSRSYRPPVSFQMIIERSVAKIFLRVQEENCHSYVALQCSCRRNSQLQELKKEGQARRRNFYGEKPKPSPLESGLRNVRINSAILAMFLPKSDLFRVRAFSLRADKADTTLSWRVGGTSLLNRGDQLGSARSVSASRPRDPVGTAVRHGKNVNRMRIVIHCEHEH